MLSINLSAIRDIGLGSECEMLATEIYNRLILDCETLEEAHDGLRDAIDCETMYCTSKWTILHEYCSPETADYYVAEDDFFNDLESHLDEVLEEEE